MLITKVEAEIAGKRDSEARSLAMNET